jgi:hypothetical protein
MVLKYSLPIFQAGLLKAIREARFFPDPLVLREHCEALKRGGREREEALVRIREVDEWKAQWLKERAEDLAAEVKS